MTQSPPDEDRAPADQRRVRPFRDARREAAGLVASFNYAFEGVLYVVRTQRNMRVHFAAALVVLLLGLQLGVDRVELLLLLLAASFVLLAEMINTAIEGAVDVSTTSFDPNAKLAKDIAAGAVLIATVNAVAVGYLVFSGQVAGPSTRFLDRIANAPAELSLVALVLTVFVGIAIKAVTQRGTPLRGGLPSIHAAIAFAGWMLVTLIVEGQRFLVSSLALILAFLVAQTRVESGVHSAMEVTYGGLVGALATLVVFQVFS